MRRYLPKLWTEMIDGWYHNSGLQPEQMGYLVRCGFMTLLQFEIPLVVAEFYGVHPGELTPDDIARVDPLILRHRIRRLGTKSLACLADVLRYSKRTTPRNWHEQVPKPEFLCA